jgi:hypothetical protein
MDAAASAKAIRADALYAAEAGIHPEHDDV